MELRSKTESIPAEFRQGTVREQPRQRDSANSEFSKSESCKSFNNAPRQLEPSSTNLAEQHDYTSRSARSRARLAELEFEMEAEKAKLPQQQSCQHRATNGRQSHRHLYDRRACVKSAAAHAPTT